MAGALYVLLAPLLPGGSIGHLEVYSNFFMATGSCLILTFEAGNSYFIPPTIDRATHDAIVGAIKGIVPIGKQKETSKWQLKAVE